MKNQNDSWYGDQTQQSLKLIFHKVKTQQAATFRAIDNKCTIAFDSIAYLEKAVSLLHNRFKQHSEENSVSSNKLWELRDKQKEFIISELQAKVKRIQGNQDHMHSLIAEKDAMILDFKARCEELKQDNQEMKEQLVSKTKQIKELIKSNSTLKVLQTVGKISKPISTDNTKLQTPQNLSQVGTKKQQIELQNSHYEQLQQKLKEMEDCLNEQIEQYRSKNIKLEQQLASMRQELDKERQNGKRIYELELKMKNLSIQNKELEDNLASEMAASHQNSLKFHQKYNELKQQVAESRKVSKTISKDTQILLRRLSAIVLGSNDKPSIFIGARTINQQFDELSKQILKTHKKQINSVIFEKDTIIEELKIVLDSNKSKIRQLNSTIEKLKNQRNHEMAQKVQALNGSISNKSTSKTDLQNKQKQKDKILEKAQKNEQRYEQKLQQLRLEIDDGEKQISGLRKKYDEYSTEMSRNYLQLQGQLAQKSMQLEYQEQKMKQLQHSIQETQRNLKQDHEITIKNLNKKIKQIQTQRQDLRAKNRETEDKVFAREKQIREMDKKIRENEEKVMKIEKKWVEKKSEYKASMAMKDKSIQDMILKNQNILNQLKIVKEKNKLLEINVASLRSSSLNVGSVDQIRNSLENKFISEKAVLEEQILRKNQEMQEKIEENRKKIEEIKKKEEKIVYLTGQISKCESQLKLMKTQNESLKQSSQKIKESAEKSNSFGQLKQEYEKREKLMKIEGEKIINQLKNAKKQVQIQLQKANQEISHLKSQNSKLIIAVHQKQKQKPQQPQQPQTSQTSALLQQQKTQISQLTSKLATQSQQQQSKQIQKKVQQSAPLLKPRKTDSIQYVEKGTSPERMPVQQMGINTIDIFTLQIQQDGAMHRILDLNEDDVSNNNQSQRKDQGLRNSNLFIDLNGGGGEDVFEICDENQEVNFGQSSTNLQIRELFTSLRIEIQKIFNQEEISFGVTKLLPQPVQDDYYQLMSYIKQKISQIKCHNELSFIMAQAGNQPSLDQSLSLPLIEHHTSQPAVSSLRKTLQQKQALIHSLMNEKTDQQNTINQLTIEKQEMEQQNQNRFMNQCNVYKKEIKEHKKYIDLLEMNFQCFKNIIRNILEAYSSDEEMEDDFRESLTMYANVAKLPEKDRSRVNFYVVKYLQVKGFQ